MNISKFRSLSAGIVGAAGLTGIVAGANCNDGGLMSFGSKAPVTEQGQASLKQSQLDAIVNNENYGLQSFGKLFQGPIFRLWCCLHSRKRQWTASLSAGV